MHISPETTVLPKLTAVGLMLSLAAILFGFGLGVAFGAAEVPLRKSLTDSGEAALATVYKGDVAAKDKVVAKSWEYLKRAHLHGAALGTAALASILAMVLLARPGTISQWSSLCFGAGALAYSVFWLLAGLRAPALGSTSAAKHSLELIAVPGAALGLFGLSGTIFVVGTAAFGRNRSAPN